MRERENERERETENERERNALLVEEIPDTQNPVTSSQKHKLNFEEVCDT